MIDNRPVGIVVAAVGISEEVRNRFVVTLHKTTPPSIRFTMVTEAKDFTRSKGRNVGILSLLGQCRVIVCTDIDMLVPEGLVEYTQREVTDGTALWAKCRNLEADQADSLDWESWKNLQVRECGTGSWVAMTAADWLRTGGWDERLAGHGGEDDVLAIRREEHRIETKVTRDFPLMHVMHPQRETDGLRVGQENLDLGSTPPPKNFLTARVPVLDDTNNHFNIFTTSRCTRDCPECSQRGFRAAWSHGSYDLSLADLKDWIACTKESGYHPYRSAILTGGDPLLWENLEEGARLIKQAGVCDQLNLFSNGDAMDRVTDSLMESLSTLRLSHYGNNSQSIEALKERYGAKVSIAERQLHFPIPLELAGDEVLPAKCGCEGPALLGRQVYGCAMLFTVTNELGVHIGPDSQCDLQVGYLELLAGFPRTMHDCCRGCIGNLALRKNAVSANP